MTNPSEIELEEGNEIQCIIIGDLDNIMVYMPYFGNSGKDSKKRAVRQV